MRGASVDITAPLRGEVREHPELGRAYDRCLAIARGHYENFPVASLLIPRHLRRHVAAVYAFARRADDLADEGDAGIPARLEALAGWRAQLTDSIDGKGGDDIFLALGETIRRFAIPPNLFHALLDAFEQDVTKTSYETFEELLAYCRRSADPVGRIMLALFGRLDERTAAPADCLCTALQLANFWQDVSIDARKPRCYIPQEDFDRFGVPSDAVQNPHATREFRRLIRFEVDRTRRYFENAKMLMQMVPFRLKLELLAIHAGGATVLDKITARDYDVLSSRPALSAGDGARVLLRLVMGATGRGNA